MKIKSLILAGALSLASVCLLSAKTYDISLSAPAQAGTVQLPAGEYHLKLNGDSAVFTGVRDDKTYTAPVKLDAVEQKFDDTAVVTSPGDGGKARIESIELGGSHTRVEFAK